jgi:hypothetical protein
MFADVPFAMSAVIIAQVQIGGNLTASPRGTSERMAALV